MVDDVLPVSEPITTASGEVVDSIFVAKDTIVTVSIRCMNQSEVFWGANAKEFEPERWHTLANDPLRAKEIQGHRHIITFIDGPRTCLGKSFALAEFKVCVFFLREVLLQKTYPDVGGTFSTDQVFYIRVPGWAGDRDCHASGAHPKAQGRGPARRQRAYESQTCRVILLYPRATVQSMDG